MMILSVYKWKSVKDEKGERGKRMTREEMTVQKAQELFDMLTGKRIPSGITIPHPPNLSPQQAFGVIWFLQEHLRIIPDTFEMCAVCSTIFDTREEGWFVDETFFCSRYCERKLF